MSSSNTKLNLFSSGVTLMEAFCQNNNLSIPELVHAGERWPFSACAYYRPTRIVINIGKCATIGVSGASWSYPGYFIDRTPYGVVQHELGHHVDHLFGENKGGYYSEYSSNVRLQSGEEKLTNYCPNDAEWFAEMFRLFVTNPDLLKTIRPRSYAIIRERLEPTEQRDWREVLEAAPARNIAQCLKRAHQA